MFRKLLILCCLISVPLILAACVQPSPPQAEFLEYKVAGIKPDGLEVNFFFNVKNDNPVGLDVTKYAYQVFIEEKQLLNVDRGGFNLPANSKQLIKIPVFIRYNDLFGSVLAVAQRIAQGKDTISFRIEGSLSAGVMGLTFNTPLKAAGNIPLPKDIKKITL